VVQIGAWEDLAHAFEEAAGGPIDVRIDPLWVSRRWRRCRPRGTAPCLVNIGQSAGPEATIASPTVRSKDLRIVGDTNMALSPEDKASAYASLAAHVAAGRVRL
jgi:hypothetical protein